MAAGYDDTCEHLLYACDICRPGPVEMSGLDALMPRQLDRLDASLVERLIISLRAPGPHLLLCRLRVLEALRSAAALRDDNEMARICEADVAKLQGRLL